MSEVRLVVREADRDWSGPVHRSSADRAVAALSADPVTLAELEAAYARYAQPAPERSFFATLSPGLCDEPYDAGLVLIDLVARVVVVASTYSSPGPTGRVWYHDGHGATDKGLPYHLADDWLFLGADDPWPAVAEERRRERIARPPRDARAVLYGRPLLEFLARETLADFVRRTTEASRAEEVPSRSHLQADEEVTDEGLKRIHAAWLLTPRDDLGGVCPRDLALQRRKHLSWDLQDQCERWSLVEACPPGVADTSFAFCFGGIGTHELVQYYGLVRALLGSCRERLAELAKTPSAASGPELTPVEAFLVGEAPRLERVRDQWLETPDPECHGRTPRSIIDRERARLPEAVAGADAVVDPDCPCCQMLADLPGPMFWHLDGSGMDDDFAFDIYHRTREEWEAERREWEEHARRFDAESAERRRLGVADRGGPEEESVWSSSFSVADHTDVPLGVRLFGIGCHLAELIVDLREQADVSSTVPQRQRFIDQLNRDFGNVREVLERSEPSAAEALLAPLLDRFAESLAAVASVHPDLSAKCASLASCLSAFLEPRPSAGEAALLAEAALAVDGQRPEEDAAWSHLQPGK